MKQKPVLLLLMALSVTLGAVVYPVTGYFHFNSKQTLEEGTHPKNVNLAGPLAINCPPPLVLMADANCMAQVVVQTPVSTCGNITFMSYTLPNGNTVLLTPPYPATINLGMWSYGLYSIIWNVSDDCPPLPTQAICRQAVKIDTQPPVIMCPDDVSVGNNEDGRRLSPAGDRMNLTNVEVGQPTATDNCTPDALITITNDFNGTDDASGQYPLGTTVVCWTATDLSGNTASCCMNVTVFDNTPPEIKCPDTLYAQCSPPDPYADFSEFMDAGGTAEDETALDSTSLTWISDMTSDSLCPNRLTIHRSYAISDTAGNADTCMQVIIINDTTPPAAVCGSVDVYLDGNGEATIEADVLDGGSTDNCGGQLSFSTSTNLFFACNDVQFGGPPISIVLTVSDPCGNTSTCTATVTVYDTVRPTIICPPAITVNANPGVCFATNVTLGVPQTDDNCTVTGVVAMFGGNNFSGSTQVPVGTNTIIWTVTDASGNTGTCGQTVTVVDNQNPTITCPAPVTVNANTGQCYATGVNLGTPVTNDNCGVQSTIARLGGSPVTPTTQFPVGTNTVTWTVTDVNGRTASCTQTVTVADNQNPTISCPAPVTVNANTGQCYATGVNLGTPVTNDNCGVQSTIATLGGSPVTPSTQFPVGTNTVTWTVTDVNGRTASCTQTVTVVDNQNPTITCLAPVTVNANTGQCFATGVNLGTPVTNDNCGVQSTIARLGGSPVTPTTQFPVGTNTVTWTVTDLSGRTATCTQTVTVVDNQNPTITCPPNQEASLNENCMLTVPDLRPLVGRSDNCGTTTITQNPVQGTVIASSHNQTHTFTFTVTDNAGLTASCSITVTAKDKTGPNIVCTPKKVISISDIPELSAQSFIVSASDNCGGPLTYSVRRMGNICGGTTPDDFGNYVQFCCDDVNKNILIVVRVTDARNNFTECMDTVMVQDKLAPTIVTSLPDISISCEYPLNLNNLSAFGTLVASGSPRQNIVIADPGNPFYPSGIAGQDGVYSDNCPGAVVTVTTRNMLTMCNTGQIKRDFTITDIGGNSTKFTQTIFVMDVHKFGPSDITWPSANADYFDCNDADPDISVTGSPVLNNDKCSMAAATYSDETFTHPLYCKLIRRTWTVLDWCQYQTNVPSSPGKWTFIQNIAVKNTVPPTINQKVCRDTVICAPFADCAATVTFNASGTDDCLPVNITWSYKIDLNNNGGTPDISGTGATVTRLYQLGTHKLTWEAKDGCKNISTCSFLFTVKDCKAPVAIAMQGLAVDLSSMGMATIKAVEFNNFSNDNCTPADKLRFSFSPDVNNKTKVLTCSDLGHKTIELWVTDLAGNQSKAVTFIEVQDNLGVCGNTGNVQISGRIYTEEKAKLPETKILIDGGETEDYVMTDTSGSFRFNNLQMYNNYQISSFKDDNPAEGISTLDLVMIQRHILGLQSLSTPYKLIAADANNSQNITAADLVELRKLVLGVQDKFSKNTSWRFVDAGFEFEDPKNPWPFNEILNYENLDASMMQSDFIAVKVGDVNGTVSENLTGKVFGRPSSGIDIYTEEAMLTAGEVVSIPVRASDLSSAVGLQFTMTLGPELTYIGIEPAGLPMGKDHSALVRKASGNYLTVAFENAKGLNVPADGVLFNVVVRAGRNVDLRDVFGFGNAVTKSLAINSNLKEAEISFSVRSQKADEDQPLALQNSPNPFGTRTSLPVYTKKAGWVTLQIFDAKGAGLYNESLYLQPGSNEIILTEKQLGNRYGVFFCRVKSGTETQTVKMLRIE